MFSLLYMTFKITLSITHVHVCTFYKKQCLLLLPETVYLNDGKMTLLARLARGLCFPTRQMLVALIHCS